MVIYVSSAQNRWANFIREIRKHPYKLYEYHTGEKLSFWRRLHMNICCRFNKSNYKKRQDAINKAIKPFIKRRLW